MGGAIMALRNSQELRWVNPLEIKNTVESALVNRFGAKGEAKPKSTVRTAASASASAVGSSRELRLAVLPRIGRGELYWEGMW
jgi:hypothetical protein